MAHTVEVGDGEAATWACFIAFAPLFSGLIELSGARAGCQSGVCVKSIPVAFLAIMPCEHDPILLIYEPWDRYLRS